MTMLQISQHRSGLVAASLLMAALASCASPQEVQRTRALAKDYERQVHDLERQLQEFSGRYADLETRYQRERRADMSEGTIDASFSRRMEDIASMIDGLEGPMQDVQRFDVEGGYVVMIQDRVLFDSGSAALGGEGAEALAALAQEINQAPHGKIIVRGHTDSDPVKKPETRARFPHGNLQLSAERAVSVAAFLIGQPGVSASDVVVMGFGPWNPLRANDSSDSKRLNRRVEILISDPES